MQKLVKAFEDMMVAITFAEAGEYDVARKISGQTHEEEVVAVPHVADLRVANKS